VCRRAERRAPLPKSRHESIADGRSPDQHGSVRGQTVLDMYRPSVMIALLAGMQTGSREGAAGRGLYGKELLHQMAAATWQGTDEEFAQLERAVTRNCDCVGGMLGLPPLTCAAHLMLVDQTTLDHLLYVYRTRRGFITREFYAFPVQASSTSRRVRW
jgi:hypothetical protein